MSEHANLHVVHYVEAIGRGQLVTATVYLLFYGMLAANLKAANGA